MPEVNNDFVIMMIDDDPDEHYFFEIALSYIDRKITLLSYYTVDNALAKMASMTILPALLIIDVNLPGKTGADMLTDLQENEQLRNIPVMLYSGVLPNETVETQNRQGITFFQGKTVDLKSLSDILAQNIKSLTGL